MSDTVNEGHQYQQQQQLQQQHALDESSVLAMDFVPPHLKEINSQLPTWILPGEQLLLTMDAQIADLPNSLFPQTPCVCNTGDPTCTIHSSTAPRTPYTVDLEYEYRFAVSEELQDIEKSLPPPALVDSIVGMSDYQSTFAKLMALERHKLLILHERFSLYDTLVSVHPGTTLQGNGVKSDNKTKEKQSPYLNASVNIPGIADARPALLAGDIVLLRPMRPLTFYVGATTHQQTNGIDLVCAEIQCQVRLVVRAPSKYARNSNNIISDKAIITWLPQQVQDSLAFTYPEGQFNFRVVPSPVYYQACMTALDWLKNFPSGVSSQLLYPMEVPILPYYDETNIQTLGYAKLNAKQKAFVKMVCARTVNPSERIRPPMVLSGPAGTGKTNALIISILEVLQMNDNCHILVCTPSHTASDVVTRRLGEYLDRSKLFRLYASTRPVSNVPVDILGYTRQSGNDGSFSLPKAAELLTFQVIVSTCSDAHILYCAGLTNEYIRERRECIKVYTQHLLKVSGLKAEINGEFLPHFTHLFIDEAAQATEPETLVPFSVVLDPSPTSMKAEITLVGDPRQLSPVIYSTFASDAGLGRSFLERLLHRPVTCLGGGYPHLLGPNEHDNRDEFFNYSSRSGENEQLCIFLTQNYRGHPSFLMMPSAMFYFDKLESVKRINEVSFDFAEKLRTVEALSEPVSTYDIFSFIPDSLQTKKQYTWPVHFLGVVGQDTSLTIASLTDSNSWANTLEAQAVVEIVEKLSKAGVSNASIGVMSPFRGQVVLIRKLLRQKPTLGGINVGTIEDYQSVERDIIVLSLTRSNIKFVAKDTEKRTGVFHQHKTTNVAMTRAEHLFIVVGNPATMICDPIWKQWLYFCLRNGFWYGERGTAFSTMMDTLSSKQLTVATHRSGPSHFLLGVKSHDEEDENVVIISTLEKELRQS